MRCETSCTRERQKGGKEREEGRVGGKEEGMERGGREVA